MGIYTYVARARGGPPSSMVLHDIWLAYDDTPAGSWALQVAARLARRDAARVTVVDAVPPSDEPGDESASLALELLGEREVDHRRRHILHVAENAAPGAAAHVRLVTGSPRRELLDLLRAEPPDLLVAASSSARHWLRRLIEPDVGRMLLRRAPCPVVVVRDVPRPRDRPAEQRHETRIVVDVDMPPPRSDARAAHRDRTRSRPTLLWRIFAANALVLVAATLILIVTPLRISPSPVLSETVSVTLGLVCMLAIHLFLLRRTLEPLRVLTDFMRSIDPRHAHRRVPDPPSTADEVSALTHAFNEMLDRLEDERRRSARRALAAQEDERLRIARELHDQIGQTLTALTIQAERAVEMPDPVDRTLLRQIAGTALQGLDEARSIGRELRPEALDDLGLPNALIVLCRRVASQSHIRITPHFDGDTTDLAPEVELVIYRIAQEAITNAVRHADAATVEVTLRFDDDTATLTVIDDGRGLPAAPPTDTAGIAGMRERADLIDGAFSIASPATGGTKVRLTVPIEART
ncbi:MAG TPA: universal stress protein [Thermoleophilaceae bacterium]|nr:universal stress protein [Thermoleophilaceae bacterium]